MKIIRLHAALIFNKRQTGAEGTLIHAEIQEIQQTMPAPAYITDIIHYTSAEYIMIQHTVHVCRVCLQMFNCPFFPLIVLILDFKADLKKMKSIRKETRFGLQVELSRCDAELRCDWTELQTLQEPDEWTSRRCAGELAAGGRRDRDPTSH